MFFPWLLIIIGTVYLLEGLNFIPAVNWAIIWPILLIITGAYLLKKRCGDDCCAWFGLKKK